MKSVLSASRCESDANAGCRLDDAGADPDEAPLQGGELGTSEAGAVGNGPPDSPQEPVGGGVQDQPDLVGEHAGAGGPVALQLGLVELDEVLGLAAGAIIELVEPLRRGAGQRGDDGADVEPEAALGLGQEQHAAVRRDPSAVEGGTDFLAAEGWNRREDGGRIGHGGGAVSVQRTGWLRYPVPSSRRLHVVCRPDRCHRQSERLRAALD